MPALAPQTEHFYRRFEGCGNDVCKSHVGAVHVDNRGIVSSAPPVDESAKDPFHCVVLSRNHWLHDVSNLNAPDDDGFDNAVDSAMATNIRFSHGAANVWILANDNGFSHTCYADDISVGFGIRSHPLVVVVVPDVCLLLLCLYDVARIDWLIIHCMAFDGDVPCNCYHFDNVLLVYV